MHGAAVEDDDAARRRLVEADWHLPLAPQRVLRDGAAMPDRFVYCDNGTQVSAYKGDTFVLAVDAETAWDGGAEITRFWPSRWQGDWRAKTWKAIPAPPPLRDFKRYLAHAEPMDRLPPAEEEFVRQLRAMGYVEE